jgi:uncharacterized protein (TIGR02391 family)
MKLRADPRLFEAVADILGATNCFLSKLALHRLLESSGITCVDDGAWTNGLQYNIGLSKRKWLFNCLAEEFNKRQTTERIEKFLEAVFDPVLHTDRREEYEKLVEAINRPLMLHGCEINAEGKLSAIPKASTLPEVDRRIDEFRSELAKRKIHQRVMFYCREDLLRKDYQSAVLEAAKGLADRVREETGKGDDGTPLFDSVFSKTDPWLFLTDLSDESKKSEQNGLRELLNAIFHLIRNPLSHKPKIKWDVNQNEALDVFVLISLAHKYLDECFVNPMKRGHGNV